MSSELEDKFAKALDEAGIKYERQAKLIPGRRFRSDFFIPPDVVVEIEGGVFTRGRHTRPIGFVNDIEKYNLYTLLKYRLLRFAASHLNKTTLPDSIKLVKEVAGQKSKRK